MWPQRSLKVTKGHEKTNVYNTASTFINVWIFLNFFENIHFMMMHLFHNMTCDLRGHLRSQMVTFCLKRSLSIASLALSLIYESLWNFLSILTLSNDPRGHLGHIRSLLYFERSISVTSIFMYRFWWNFQWVLIFKNHFLNLKYLLNIKNLLNLLLKLRSYGRFASLFRYNLKILTVFYASITVLALVWMRNLLRITILTLVWMRNLLRKYI